MIAGTSRNDFLRNYALSQLDGAAGDYYTDTDKHSKSHHQQYSDFIRSAKYKNPYQLLTCASCHDPHRRTEFAGQTSEARQLKGNPADNAASCGNGCHDQFPTPATSPVNDLEGHLVAQGIPLAGPKAAIALCSDCHMPKTAKTGAGKPGLNILGVQYWDNDITSHLFKVPDRSWAKAPVSMPVPYTNACGTCHADIGAAP